MLKGLEKMEMPQKVLFGILFVILIVAIFTPKSSTPLLSAGLGIQGHLGNLKGSFNVETMENQANPSQSEATLFYAPWCGHCKNMMPEWDSLGDKVGSVKLTKVNADENQELASKHGVQGFPTIIHFKQGMENGNGEVYEGERSADAMRNWISAKGAVSTGPNDGLSAPVDYTGVI